MIQIPTLTEQSLRELIYTTVKGCLAEMQLDLYNSSPVIQKVEPEPEKPQLKRKDKGFYRELVDWYYKNIIDKCSIYTDTQHYLFVGIKENGCLSISAHGNEQTFTKWGTEILWYAYFERNSVIRPNDIASIIKSFIKNYKFYSHTYKNSETGFIDSEYYKLLLTMPEIVYQFNDSDYKLTYKEYLSIIVFIIKHTGVWSYCSDDMKLIKARLKDLITNTKCKYTEHDYPYKFTINKNHPHYKESYNEP